MPKVSRRVRPDHVRILPVAIVAERLERFMDEQRLAGPILELFIHSVCPWWPAWVRDEGGPHHITLSTVLTKFEQHMEGLLMDREDHRHFREVVVPEMTPPVSRGCPTDAPPGTESKVQVMIARAERGEALFHPQDLGLPDYLAFVSIVRGRETERLEMIDVQERAKGGVCDSGEQDHVPPPGVCQTERWNAPHD